jgi:cytochrome c-type biogenesis protein CcmH
LLWIIAALLTAIVTIIIISPLGRLQSVVHEADDVSVYKDQLLEIEHDKKQGLLEEDQADAARTEVARRLLAAAQRPKPQNETKSHRIVWAKAISILLLPLLTVGLYILLGNPALSDFPLKQRQNKAIESNDISMLVKRVEEHLSNNPQDGKGWDIIAPVYVQLDRLDQAVEAYQNAIRILGSTAERQSNMGEVLVTKNDGRINDDALDAFKKAAELDKNAIKPRFFIAKAYEQDGEIDRARQVWQELIDKAPTDASWLSSAKSELAMLDKKNTPVPVGQMPTREDVENASRLNPEEREAMIESMVAKLAERLKQQPEDKDGWLRLIKSYKVLGRDEEAGKAYTTALQLFADNKEMIDRLDKLAKSFQINQ